MSTSNLPEYTATHGARLGAVLFLSLLLLSPVLLVVPPADAQAAGAQRAIEKLENCSGKERKSGCVNILKVERGKGDKQAVKARIRGGRIIWYEYDRKSGNVRRTN
jgi:hypothetical protein